jgi:hypothetical protein
MSYIRDFTLSAYELLLTSLQARGYRFYTFEHYLATRPSGKILLLRHDVDRVPLRSLETAVLERRLGIQATYYFRIVKQSNDPDIIQAIADMNHEIGYHYEDLTLENGDKRRALDSFVSNLNYFRQYYPVRTICMHGSPMSSWDNRDLWTAYDYHDYGITGEPYFDLDFNRFLYLTDTGRRWNGEKVSVRDKVYSGFNPDFRSTFDILNELHRLPEQVMITTHPQRWENQLMPWMAELVFQNMKNSIKRILVKT